MKNNINAPKNIASEAIAEIPTFDLKQKYLITNRDSEQAQELLKYIENCYSEAFIICKISFTELKNTDGNQKIVEIIVEAITTALENHQFTSIPGIDEEEVLLDCFPALNDWMKQIENILRCKFLVFLEDFENVDKVVNYTGLKTCLNFLKAWNTSISDAWNLIFCTSKKHEELEIYWSDYLIECLVIEI